MDSLLEPPSASQLRAIKQEINEDDNRMQHAENLLNTWINYQAHFPKNCDKRVIRNFLRNTKHDLEKTKTKLECYFNTSNTYPKLFTNRNTDERDVEKAVDAVTMVVLPKLTEDGNRICVFKVEDSCPENFEVEGICKYILMLCDFFMTSEYPTAGIILIIDTTGLSAGHTIKCLAMLRIIVPILRQAYSIRLKQIHIIRAPPSLEKILGIVKPLLHHKIRNAFLTHNSNSSLCEHFGEEVLPSDYDGICRTLVELKNNSKEVLNKNEKWFLEQETVKITRPVPKQYQNYSGADGSFRTLAID